MRSGQQVSAAGSDLIVIGAVNAGAEVLAAGSIHVYGALRGRALAGIHGNTQAGIYCRELEAELLSVAGNYKRLERYRLAAFRARCRSPFHKRAAGN